MNEPTQRVFKKWQIACMGGLISFGVLALDLWSKQHWFDQARSFPSLLPTLTRVDHRNFGIIGNIAVPHIGILILSFFLLLALVWFLVLSIRHHRILSVIATSLVIGGALGNTYDRLQIGYVRDWLLLFNRSAFNVADVSILVGLVWLLVLSRREFPLRKT